jgi:N-acylneuraminate cytidylyltransferase
VDTSTGILAVIPARGGSKGLPGKNIRPFCGLPLIAHSILLAKSCHEIVKVVVSTDSPEIAEVAKKYGASVPFLRPAELAKDDTPTWPVLQHALNTVEKQDGENYRWLLLLEPTTPCRHPQYVMECFQRMMINGDADGIVGVSKQAPNPIWNSVVDSNGYLKNLIPESAALTRRQDAPPIFRINGSIYMWRAEFVKEHGPNWRENSHLMMYETPDFSSISIDTQEEFDRAESLVKNGLVKLPWLEKNEVVK